MIKTSDYQDLKVWQKAIDLTVEVYELVKLQPRDEHYALSDQMRRAAISIPSNIAEGQGRITTKEFIRFLSMARGSLWEISSQIELCERLNYLDQVQTSNARQMIIEISKMTNALAQSFNRCDEQ
jgi:four helix bundle protein